MTVFLTPNNNSNSYLWQLLLYYMHIKKILATLLSIAIGIVFLFSAYAKIPTLEQFGWTIVETTFLTWTAAEWLARILIGFEFFLGFLFIFHFAIAKTAIPWASLLLVVFSAYLFYVMKKFGNNGNCGCFGEMLRMTPQQAILKNVILLAAMLVLYFISYSYTFAYQQLLMAIVLLACLIFPVVVNKPESIYIKDKEKTINDPIPLSILYNDSSNVAPTTELRKGKHVVAFMSLTCEFCRKAAKRMRIMYEKDSTLPFYLILNGDSTNRTSFFEDTKTQYIPHSFFNGAEKFTALTGTHGLPAIKWIQDTTIVRTSNYITLDEDEVKTWMQKN